MGQLLHAVSDAFAIDHCLAKFLGLHFCLYVSKRIKQCLGLLFDFSLHSLICRHHSHPYFSDRISRSFSPVPRQPHRDVCYSLSRLASIDAWLQVCWQSQAACTCSSASLNFLAFTTASLSASVLSIALTCTSLRVWRHVSLPFCTLACIQERLLVPRLSHHIVCLHFS